MRSTLTAAICVSAVIAVASAARAQGNSGSAATVDVNIQAGKGVSGTSVKLIFLGGPDSLLGRVTQVVLPTAFSLPAQSLRIQIVPLAASVISVDVRLSQGGRVIKETSVSGAGGSVLVNEGSVSASGLKAARRAT